MYFVVVAALVLFALFIPVVADDKAFVNASHIYLFDVLCAIMYPFVCLMHYSICMNL